MRTRAERNYKYAMAAAMLRKAHERVEKATTADETEKQRAAENLAKYQGEMDAIEAEVFGGDATVTEAKARVAELMTKLDNAQRDYAEAERKYETEQAERKRAQEAAIEAEARRIQREHERAEAAKRGTPTSAEALVSAYTTNEVAADARYKGGLLEVTGIIQVIGKDILDSPYVALKAGDEFSFRSVQCVFSRNNAGSLMNLRPGNSVTIRGRCVGLMMNVILKDCELVY